VLSSLATLAVGGNPDEGRQRLPLGLASIMDLSRTGMFGHCLGGDTAAQTMAADDRISAGIDLDGSIIPTVPFTRANVGELAGAVATRLGDAVHGNGRALDDDGHLMAILRFSVFGWLAGVGGRRSRLASGSLYQSGRLWRGTGTRVR
jgi:hypothetical protein